MRYESRDIDLARKHGAPEPEENIARANAVLSLLDEERFDEARSRLAAVTDPAIRESLEKLIDFESHWFCVPR